MALATIYTANRDVPDMESDEVCELIDNIYNGRYHDNTSYDDWAATCPR
jgi:hypothetical protein